MAEGPSVERRMWWLLEPIHAVLYYAPEGFEQAAALGYDIAQRWPSYFAWRAAPLGAAGVELVSATFYSFSPSMVAENVPAAWRTATPQRVLETRLRAVEAIYNRLLGADRDEATVREAALLARRAAEAAPLHGRPLAAANADQPWQDDPCLVLWQAATILREHRGDGHLAALLAFDLDPVESLVSFASVDAAPAETFASRGWSEPEWSRARERLAARGLVGPEAKATDRGLRLRADIEQRTDELARAPWDALGPDSTARLAELLTPIFGAVVGSGVFPDSNTLAVGKRFDR